MTLSVCCPMPKRWFRQVTVYCESRSRPERFARIGPIAASPTISPRRPSASSRADPGARSRCRRRRLPLYRPQPAASASWIGPRLLATADPAGGNKRSSHLLTLAAVVAVSSPVLAQRAPSQATDGADRRQSGFTTTNPATAAKTKRVTTSSHVRIKPSGEVVTAPPQ